MRAIIGHRIARTVVRAGSPGLRSLRSGPVFLHRNAGCFPAIASTGVNGYTYTRIGWGGSRICRYIGASRETPDAEGRDPNIPTETCMKLCSKLVVGVLAVGIATAVSAQELTGTLKKIKDTGSITIGNRESSIPFSYLDDKQQPIGYSMDLCNKIVDAIKAELKLPNLKVTYNPVTSQNRIPLVQNGTV